MVRRKRAVLAQVITMTVVIAGFKVHTIVGKDILVRINVAAPRVLMDMQHLGHVVFARCTHMSLVDIRVHNPSLFQFSVFGRRFAVSE
jgi:hypothetical protein